MALIVLVIGTGLVLLYRSHILEDWINRYLAEKIATKYNVEITINEIGGSFVDGFVLSDVRVRSLEAADSLTLAYFPRVNISYSVSNLWNHRWIIDSLQFDNPQLNIRQDSSGRWVLPRITGTGKSTVELPSWQVQKLTLDRGELNLILPKKTVRWFDINLLTSIKSEQGTYTLDVEQLRFNSDDGRLRVNDASGRATLYQQRLVLQDVAMATDSSRLALSLIYDNSAITWIEAKIDSAHICLPDIMSFLGLDLTGTLDIQGTVYRQHGQTGGDILLSGFFQNRFFDSLHTRFRYADGRVYLDTLDGTILNGCALEGSGEIDFASHPEAYRLNGQILSLNLDNLIRNSFWSDLNGRIQLKGRGLRSKSLVIDLDLDLDESHFDIYHLYSIKGQMTVTSDGLHFFPGFAATYHDNRFLFDGGLVYDGKVSVSGRADLVNLADFTHQTFIDLPSGRGKADFALTGLIADPDLGGRFVSDSAWFYRFFSSDFRADFDVKSFTHSKRGRIFVVSRHGEGWDFPYDSLSANLTLDSNLLLIDSGNVANKFSRSSVHGILNFENYPQDLTLNGITIDLSGRQFTSDGDQLIRIDSSGFVFDRIRVNTSEGHISSAGRVNYDETMDMNWDINQISIAPWAALINDTLRIDGNLSSVGKIYGPFENPELNVQVTIDSLSYRSLSVGDLTAHFTYQDSVMQIDSGVIKSAEGRYLASGEFPVNLALASGHRRFDERQQHILIQAADKRLDVIPFFMPSVEYVTGDFSGEVTLTGTVQHPHFNGHCLLNNGVVKPSYLRDCMEQAIVELVMQDQLVTVKKAEAIMPRKPGKEPGKISGEGTIFISDLNHFAYDLKVKCLDIPIEYEMGNFSGTADAQLQVVGSTPPKVTGSILMRSAYYRENFTEEDIEFSLLTSLEGDKTWDFDLMVDCPSNFWVKNSDIDAEFSGSVNVLRTAGVYNYLGTLEVIRGRYFLLHKTFTIASGGQIIYDNIEKPDPTLALDVSTRVRSQNRFSDFEGETSYSYELNLAITGTLNNPIITGTGDTPISTEEILPTLLTGYQSSSADSTSDPTTKPDRFTTELESALAGQFTRLGTRSFGVETFEVDPSWAKGFDPTGTRFTIGAYTLPNLYVFGSSTLSAEKGQEVGMEYRLGRHYLFEGRRDEENLYHFNFKFSWEY